MTTIFYDGKNLHADKKIIHTAFPSRASNGAVKIFRNKKNTMALGTCGLLPDEKTQENLFKSAEIIFRLMYLGKIVEAEDLNKIDKNKNKKTRVDMIAITSNKAFMLKDETIYPQTGFMGALGTGARSIIGCYYVVSDIATAFRLSADIDTLSSPEYMSIMADSLNPYVME